MKNVELVEKLEFNPNGVHSSFVNGPKNGIFEANQQCTQAILKENLSFHQMIKKFKKY